MPDHRAPDPCGSRSPGFPSMLCDLGRGHDEKHAARRYWTDADTDEAPTLRLPPVRESLGPRRRPPAPVVAELSERVNMLQALVEELAGYDDDEAPQ